MRSPAPSPWSAPPECPIHTPYPPSTTCHRCSASCWAASTVRILKPTRPNLKTYGIISMMPKDPEKQENSESLPVLDDMERALNAIPEKFSRHDWVEGVRLVERKFKTILEGQGVKPILTLGMAFDPNLHEALRQEKGEEGIIISEIQKGYMLHDKLLRPARVVVGKGEEEESKEEE